MEEFQHFPIVPASIRLFIIQSIQVDAAARKRMFLVKPYNWFVISVSEEPWRVFAVSSDDTGDQGIHDYNDEWGRLANSLQLPETKGCLYAFHLRIFTACDSLSARTSETIKWGIKQYWPLVDERDGDLAEEQMEALHPLVSPTSLETPFFS